MQTIKESSYLGYFYSVLAEGDLYSAEIADPFSDNVTVLNNYRSFDDANLASKNFILSCVIDSEIKELVWY